MWWSSMQNPLIIGVLLELPWRISKPDDGINRTPTWEYKQEQWTYCSYRHSYSAFILLLAFGINTASLRRQWPAQPYYTKELCSFQGDIQWVLVTQEELLCLTSPAVHLKWMYHPEGNLHQSRLISEKGSLYLRSANVTFISCCCLLRSSLAQELQRQTSSVSEQKD